MILLNIIFDHNSDETEEQTATVVMTTTRATCVYLNAHNLITSFERLRSANCALLHHVT